MKDIAWVAHPGSKPCSCSPTESRRSHGLSQSLRSSAPSVGRVLVNSAVDRPWSVLLHGERKPGFVRKHPVAPNGRCAILKSATFAPSSGAGRAFMDKGYRSATLCPEVMRICPTEWREQAEDTCVSCAPA
jgi:hypothetical protein